MTLIKCKTCGKELSSEAKICPNCGTIKYIGLKIDHVIIFIVVIILSVTIFNTYATEEILSGNIPGGGKSGVRIQNSK